MSNTDHLPNPDPRLTSYRYHKRFLHSYTPISIFAARIQTRQQNTANVECFVRPIRAPSCNYFCTDYHQNTGTQLLPKDLNFCETALLWDQGVVGVPIRGRDARRKHRGWRPPSCHGSRNRAKDGKSVDDSIALTA